MSLKEIKRRLRGILFRKGERRFYPCSVTLTMGQIEWMRERGNASGLIRSIIDGLMANESEAKLRETEERIKLLWYKARVLGGEAQELKDGKEREERGKQYRETMDEIERLEKVKEKIESAIEERKRQKARLVKEKRGRESARYL